MPGKPIRRVYFNRAQLEAMVVGARYEYIVAGRGTGKSEGFDARVLVRNALAMPGSAGALLSPSISKLKRQTFPAIANALGRWGYVEGLHYVVGRAPARQLRFGSPIIRPFDYDNVVSFYNGSIVHMLSFDRAMSANSLSLDYLIGPEARYLDYGKLTAEVLPAVRGNRGRFGRCPWHGGHFFSTDMPQGSRGAWILDKRRDMDPELIELIKRLYLAWQSAAGRGSARGQQAARALHGKLQRARSQATFFGLYSSLENLEVLGEEWFAQQERSLPPSLFAASILNQRVRQTGTLYYPELSETRHLYDAPSAAQADRAAYGSSPDSRWDGDVDPRLPLLLASDYNAAINTLVVGQAQGATLRVLNALWVKSPQRLEDVLRNFCAYYGGGAAGSLVYYYDHTAIARSAASSQSFAEIALEILRGSGFSVSGVYIGRTAGQALRYDYINSALRGSARYLFPVFERARCADLLEALRRARVSITHRGFGKDKREERLPDSPELPDQHKTHFTDAFDTLFMGANLYPVAGSGALLTAFR